MPSNRLKNIQSCPWVPKGDALYELYHDTEWGVPVYNDRILFEFLVLESAQAGLSWRIILAKRSGYRKAFANFNPIRIARFTQRDIQRLLKNPGIIRNRQKINAAIVNARQFIKIQKEFGSFSRYMWEFVDNAPIQHRLRKLSDYPKTIPQAEIWAKDLKNRGFSFLGPIVCYAHMQAIGMVNDHTLTCPRYHLIARLGKRASHIKK